MGAPNQRQRFVVRADRGHIDEHPTPGLTGFQDTVRDKAVYGAAMDREEAGGVLGRNREGVWIEGPDGLDDGHAIAPRGTGVPTLRKLPRSHDVNA